jgi:hypothetical protein
MAMRIALLTLPLIFVGVTLFATPPAGAVDCGQLRSSCAANCANVANIARRQACATRCSLTVCPTIPSLCRPGDQTVCRNGFSSCNGACDALAAIPSAAATANATACVRKCCSNFRQCLSLRSCDVSGISC